MTLGRSARGPIVIDTGVFAADLVPGSALVPLYEPIIVGRPVFLSFQTVAEIRYGALRRGWGEGRMLRLQAKLDRTQIVWAGPELVETYAKLRVECQIAGHPLGQGHHDGDRWVACAAIRLGVPLVAHDRIFEGVPGLVLETALSA